MPASAPGQRADALVQRFGLERLSEQRRRRGIGIA
jgi:hypothetical protein